MRIAPLLLLSLCAVLTLNACDSNSRRIEGTYRLRRISTHTGVSPSNASYFLWDTARPENEVGWSGAVMRIGWDARYILVLRAAPPTPYGAAAGWMLIDVEHGTPSAIMTAEQIRQRPDIARIATYRADSAWTRL